MNDPRIVRGHQRRGALTQHFDAFGQRSHTLHAMCERFTAHEFHRDERAVAAVTYIVDRDDVRVIERRCRACLTRKARNGSRIGKQARGEHLKRDIPLESLIACAIHLAHPAGAERFKHFKMTENGSCREWHRC